jgi:hypothetical protein
VERASDWAQFQTAWTIGRFRAGRVYGLWSPSLRVVRYPVSGQEGEMIWQSVVSDVERGVRWLPHDNCQDLATRAVTGHNGSPTRDAIVDLGFIAALVWLAASN